MSQQRPHEPGRVAQALHEIRATDAYEPVAEIVGYLANAIGKDGFAYAWPVHLTPSATMTAEALESIRRAEGDDARECYEHLVGLIYTTWRIMKAGRLYVDKNLVDEGGRRPGR